MKNADHPFYKTMTDEQQQKLFDAVNRIIEETPTMPVAVSDMTPNEYALFEQIARMSGMLNFVRHMLSGVDHDAAIRAMDDPT